MRLLRLRAFFKTMSTCGGRLFSLFISLDITNIMHKFLKNKINLRNSELCFKMTCFYASDGKKSYLCIG